MTLNLVSTFADTSVQSGSSGSLAVSIPSNRQTFLVLSIATSNRAVNTITSAKLQTDSPNDFLNLTREVQGFGCEIWTLAEPPPTLIGDTKNVLVELSGSYTFGMAIYIFEVSKTTAGNFGLDGQATGNPTLSGFAVDVGSYIVDSVAIESNTIEADNDQVEVMNLTSGGNSYASSYKICDATTENMSWSRTGTPVDDSWIMCEIEVEQNATTKPLIINS